MDRRIQKKLQELVDESCAPGFSLALGFRDRSLGGWTAGLRDEGRRRLVKKSTLFDLASLTKIISTVSLIGWARQSGKLDSLDATLGRFFPTLQSSLRERSIRELLHHRASLPPVFESIDEWQDSRESRVRFFLSEVDKQYQPGMAETYSDVGYMLLGLILEEVFEKRLRDLFLEVFGDRDHLTYGPLQFGFEFLTAIYPLPHIAPTWSLTEPKHLLKGLPQDPRAQWLGGDAGHAGLFGTAIAVEEWAREIWTSYQGKGLRLSDRILRDLLSPDSFSRRFRGGFDTPTGNEHRPSQAGHLANPATVVGHLGYTGASFWMDLEKGWRVTLLSHRHGPLRDDGRLNHFRPLFHDWLQTEVFSKL